MSADFVPALVMLVVVAALCLALGWMQGVDDGRYQGRVQVASGQYSCALVAKPDKTTEWACNPTKEAAK